MPRVHNDRSSARRLWSSRARADARAFLSWIVEIKCGPFFDITLVPYIRREASLWRRTNMP